MVSIWFKLKKLGYKKWHMNGINLLLKLIRGQRYSSLESLQIIDSNNSLNFVWFVFAENTTLHSSLFRK